MAIATRPKPNIHHRKRRAQHHRHSKSYLGTYWPYLPLFALVAGGAIVNKLWTAGLLPGVSGGQSAGSVLAAGGATRIQIIAGNRAPAALVIVIAISGAAFAALVFRHWRRISRVIAKGEAFAYKHAWLDVITALICTVGVLLTRTGGV